MLRDAFAVFSRAVLDSVETVTSSIGGVFVVVLYIAGVIFLYSRRGASGVRVEYQELLLNGLPPVVLACLVILGYHLLKVPSKAYSEQKALATSSVAEVRDLKATLERKRHSLDDGDPARHNMLQAVRVFMKYRRAIGPETRCRLLITAHKDAARFASQMIGFAVAGANCPNGDLQNVGIKPQDVEALERQADKEGKVVVHALPDNPGANSLVDDLSNLFQAERSYKFPDAAVLGAEQVVWLHFGPGSKWNTELFGQ